MEKIASQLKSVSELAIHSTVRIECTTKEGDKSSGSGFFYNFKIGDSVVPAIVTNKHVVKNSLEGVFYLTKKNKNGGPDYGNKQGIAIDNFEQGCIMHPDPNTDLCIFLIGRIINQLPDLFYIPLKEDLIPSDDEIKSFSALEDVIMIGYPTGIWDEINNLPIIRKGVTATPLSIDFNGKKEFMIDMACFPGSSGSPVFIINEGSYNKNSGGIVLGNRMLLIGILYAGPQINTKGKVQVVQVPSKNEVQTLTAFPINLGYVIKSAKMKSFNDIIKKKVEKN